MKVVVGLGNPGSEYANTRHNAGFLAVDVLLEKYGWEKTKNEFNGEVYFSQVNGEKVYFLKPLTFMNNSGQAIQALMNYYKVPLTDLIVLYDEKDFPLGRAQFKEQGSSGGHNGIKSIVQSLNSQGFKRLRIGIGQPQAHYSLVDWVLSKFSKDELARLKSTVNQVVMFLEDWTKGEGFDKIMSKYNYLVTKGENNG
ncbi:aminoacyl-tRNA hydrolase [Mesoplasma whartonense]|uniref:aminoacyl-tRNA hydrolase n=1 Tax=Mesoplasma whartonense TaxID=2878854 RepID=UPI002022B2DB|nr:MULTISPECIES: aminoacyl-tRNA hydrolase [unclassified Mesoplasma]MCL8212804.1 Peptidyl-tRNA hydrolase [Mesoplasma sp. JKS002661]MCL8215805.1 Peptidyl-tRNA hydrolase [Mesoplasma sp. JKS002657]